MALPRACRQGRDSSFQEILYLFIRRIAQLTKGFALVAISFLSPIAGYPIINNNALASSKV